MHSGILFSALLAIFCCFVGVSAYPEGAPSSSCADMIAQHGSDPSTAVSPYETVPAALQVVQGGTLGLTLQNITDQNYSFKGYLTMAFDASKPNDNTPIGTFSAPSNGKTLDCLNLAKSAITHVNNDIKKSITAVWNAPANFVGSVVFKTSFVRGGSSYWAAVPSATVTVTAATNSVINNYRVEQRA